ncbi:hypothetical protein RMR21_024360 (plasmid) [Agrobacterium sp. rho-8.1]|nr:hypothetical protein [Agrobacterium sp. rho-8.1]
MKKLISLIILASFSCFNLPSTTRAESAVTELLQKYLANGRIGEADEQMLALATKATKNADAQLGLGLV